MKQIIYLIIFIIITGCGFKVVNLSELNNYNITTINIEGEKRVNYLIKNNLKKTKNDKTKEDISLFIKTKKNKNIKEKNIKNEITKYEIIITNQIEVEKINSNKKYNFSITEIGTFDVSSQNSLTRTNEKNLIKLLSANLADKILSEINIQLDDS